MLDYVVIGLLEYVKLVRKNVGIDGKIRNLDQLTGKFMFWGRVSKGEFYGGD